MSAEEVRHTYVHIASELIFYNTETIIDGVCRMWMIKCDRICKN